MTISDEMLMAYLDNELPADERARVDAALMADADLRARLERQAHVHVMLDKAFGPLVNDPVPERFVDLVRNTPVSWRWRLSRAFAGLSGGAETRGFVPRFAPAMALLVVGLGVGFFFARMTPGHDGGGPLAARGSLAQALETQLASDDVLNGPRVGVTFRSKDGAVCRTFDMRAERANRAGVACRDSDGWAIAALAAAEARTGSAYETASAGMPAAVRDAVAAMIGGEALDAEAERRARDGGWR
jgi:hypothetical protein